jgi:hypothetical protein
VRRVASCSSCSANVPSTSPGCVPTIAHASSTRRARSTVGCVLAAALADAPSDSVSTCPPDCRMIAAGPSDLELENAVGYSFGWRSR